MMCIKIMVMYMYIYSQQSRKQRTLFPGIYLKPQRVYRVQRKLIFQLALCVNWSLFLLAQRHLLTSLSSCKNRIVKAQLEINSDQHLISPNNITPESHENIGNNHHLKKLLIVKQILLVCTLGNV